MFSVSTLPDMYIVKMLHFYAGIPLMTESAATQTSPTVAMK